MRKNNTALKSIFYFFLGILIFVLIYGLVPLQVTEDGWILNGYVETDIIQRYAGWMAYRQADSFFPLTYSGMISFPFGDYTSLADSIPLAEIIFKLFSPVLPSVFQFCGLLCCFNMAMQTLSASLVLRHFVQDELTIFLGSLLFCLSPVLLERIFRHTSLTFHWLILLAFYCYFERQLHSRFVLLCGLSVLTVWFHPYFTPMVFGIFLAALADSSLARVCRRQDWIYLAAAVPLTLLSMKALGILGIGVSNTSGYGTMGMNLNALFNPVSLDSSWWVPGCGKMHWSAFLPVRALSHNNLESFNYLGLGVLISLFILFCFLFYRLVHSPKVWIRNIRSLLFSHLFLFLFLAFSTLFAISNVVCAFSFELFHFPLPQFILDLCNVFRASGRLFWPVHYILLLIAVLQWKKLCYKQHLSQLLVFLVICIQLIDLSPVLWKKHQDFRAAAPYAQQAWADEFLSAAEHSDTVYFLELRDDRPLCAVLLKEGISNNLWLINRDHYGVDKNLAEIERVTAALLNGSSPYENCTYVTSDSALAEEICNSGVFSYIQVNADYLISPC